jgi:hypothetical protein
MRIVVLLLLVLLCAVLPAVAQVPAPKAYEPSEADRHALETAKGALAERLRVVEPRDGLDTADAEVFLHVAEMADRLHLYTNPGQVAAVLRGLGTGLTRCDALERGERPWATQPGRSLRGYVSRIDGSVQPYEVTLPAGYDAQAKTPMRLDVVLHGRGPTEVSFLQQSEPAPGLKAPEEPFIELQPFGRGNNGWRWAGETDVFEALAAVRKQYAIDPDRVILRGFSMGGHGAWHLGVHHPGEWAAVSPGAGFTETRRYMNITAPVPEYQERAWHIYDAVDYALNLFDVPFIAYGGEKDPQLQASLNMREAAAKEGLPFNLIIGPNTQHRYHPDSFKEIMRQLAPAHRDPAPKRIRFVTYTLKYPRCHWITIHALQEHYRRATVDADATGTKIVLRTENVTELSLERPPRFPEQVEIDGQRIPARTSYLHRAAGRWTPGPPPPLPPSVRTKSHNLQGPIDDAFTERFLVVRGTGTPWSAATQRYADDLLRRFAEEWRLGFRGRLRVKDDTTVTQADLDDGNVILLGDPGSNALLAQCVDQLPIRWTRSGVEANGRKFGPEAVPALIYPNPFSLKHYVVVNSGHTFTARDLEASNASLTPKLPDWAILKPSEGVPEVLDAGFFDERWRFKQRPRPQ